MTTGTALVVLPDTVASPIPSGERKETQVQLISTIGMLRLPKDTVISSDYKLQNDLTAEVKIENGKYVILDYQVDEYGIGDTPEEAQQDLLDSLVDYLTSLEKREHRLADRELHKLRLLRNMLARS